MLRAGPPWAPAGSGSGSRWPRAVGKGGRPPGVRGQNHFLPPFGQKAFSENRVWIRSVPYLAHRDKVPARPHISGRNPGPAARPASNSSDGDARPPPAGPSPLPPDRGWSLRPGCMDVPGVCADLLHFRRDARACVRDTHFPGKESIVFIKFSKVSDPKQLQKTQKHCLKRSLRVCQIGHVATESGSERLEAEKSQGWAM